MPFSSLRDPLEIARAEAALEQVWAEIERLGISYHGTPDGERTRLAEIVVGLLSKSATDAELVRRALSRFVEMRG